MIVEQDTIKKRIIRFAYPQTKLNLSISVGSVTNDTLFQVDQPFKPRVWRSISSTTIS